MPNINVTVNDTTYREARIWAAIHNTNVSEMVRRFLDLVAHDSVSKLAGNVTPPDERLEAIASTFNEFSEPPVVSRYSPVSFTCNSGYPGKQGANYQKTYPLPPSQAAG